MEQIKITMSNSQEVIWEKDQWDDYHYDGKVFAILNKGVWVGIYNLDYIISITVK